MKSSLFRDRPTRKTRMTMMVAGAVLVHFGIVGVGAMWKASVMQRKDDPTVLDVIGPGLEPVDNQVQYVTVENTAPTPSQESSTPTPEVSVPSDPLPSEVVPEMSDLSDATPPPRPRQVPSRTANPSAMANSTRATPGTSGAPTGNPGSTAGVPGSGRTGAQGWKMPKPPYPMALRTTGLQGATTLRITTDANGNVTAVEIIRSAGNALLDHNTQVYVREFWKGPPNATRTTEFVYQLL